MNIESIITFDPEICGGRPTIRGMRIRVADVLQMLGHGESIEQVLTDFPDLTEFDIRACLLFAAQRTDFERLAA
jgi:uncharacterized protein (DUF433 family)